MAPMSTDQKPTPANRRSPAIATLAARLAPATARDSLSHPLIEPIVQSTVFTFDNLEALEEFYTQTAISSHIYYRYGHPNAATLERAVAELDGADDAVTTASGMAAIWAVVAATCATGDQVVIQAGAYGGTYALARHDFERFGVEATFAGGDAEAIAAAMTPRTQLVLVEAITNPLLRVPDVAAIAGVVHERGARLVVDSSFASPALIRPLDLGADVVVHSLPKYIGGHSAAMGGAISGRTDVIAACRQSVMTQGNTIGPFDAWMALQGLRTLPLRMRAHSENALTVARWLEERDGVAGVNYPGLASHPDHAIATRLLRNGFGGMVSFDLDGGVDAARSFLARAGDAGIPFSPSLADLRTTVSYPAATSHRSLEATERYAAGIGDGLIRLSVGIEAAEDIIASLDASI